MKPAEFDRALAERKIPPLLLLHGEESFLLENALGRLLDIVVSPPDRDFNFQVFRGKETQAAKVLDSARTLPVFAPRRCVLIREADQLPASELEILLPYLSAPAPETVLVLVAEKIDGRRKFYQDFRKFGEMVEFRPLYENQIPAFVKDQARSAGRSFTDDALALFCRRLGNNLQEVHGELVKLFSYLGERKLADVADVADVVSDTRVDSIFDLTNALGQKRRDEAFRLLLRLIDEGVAPLLILNMLTRHFRQLWMVRELLEQKTAARDIAKRIGVNPFFLDGLINQARQFSTKQYRSAFERFLETDLALKSSGAHPRAHLQKLVLDLGRD
ncbi:MAG: DNA polymerase III subunit delta [Desulfuromonadales bacterium]